MVGDLLTDVPKTLKGLGLGKLVKVCSWHTVNGLSSMFLIGNYRNTFYKNKNNNIADINTVVFSRLIVVRNYCYENVCFDKILIQSLIIVQK